MKGASRAVMSGISDQDVRLDPGLGRILVPLDHPGTQPGHLRAIRTRVIVKPKIFGQRVTVQTQAVNLIRGQPTLVEKGGKLAIAGV